MFLTISRKAEGSSNPYKLPRGEKLRRELVAWFGLQHKAIIRWLRTGKKDGNPLDLAGPGGDGLFRLLAAGVGRRVPAVLAPSPGPVGRKDQGPPLPDGFPAWDDFGLGNLAMSERMTPILSLFWDAAGGTFASRVGMDPDAWSITNPETARMIEEAALAFCESTNDTTSKDLDDALEELRDQLKQGIVDLGEALDLLTKRVTAVFEGATGYRARRIAWTETSRAVHAAQEAAAIASGVVTGWRWLASGDACPTCVAIAARCRFVKLGQPFAVIGSNEHYSTIKYPPAHPLCLCTVVEVLDTDEQPEWGETLVDPDPATEQEQEQIGAELQAGYDAILAGSKRERPAPAMRPVPLARKRRRSIEVMA